MNDKNANGETMEKVTLDHAQFRDLLVDAWREKDKQLESWGTSRNADDETIFTFNLTPLPAREAAKFGEGS